MLNEQRVALSINDLVSAVVDANGNIPLAVERLNTAYGPNSITASMLISQLAGDPTAQDMIARQFRVKATLTTYGMLNHYEAALLASLDDEDRPPSLQGIVGGFSAIANLFGNLTQSQSNQPTGNIFDRVIAALPPDVREAVTTLAQQEAPLPAPTPIRKRGRPTVKQLADSD